MIQPSLVLCEIRNGAQKPAELRTLYVSVQSAETFDINCRNTQSSHFSVKNFAPYTGQRLTYINEACKQVPEVSRFALHSGEESQQSLGATPPIDEATLLLRYLIRHKR
jgi:hypothetical protein